MPSFMLSMIPSASWMRVTPTSPLRPSSRNTGTDRATNSTPAVISMAGRPNRSEIRPMTNTDPM